MQGLLISENPVSTPYSYQTCVDTRTSPDGVTFCNEYSSIEVESASLVPPFTYNNQCGSVVLTSYIPVFLLGYSIQLLLLFVVMALLLYLPYDSLPHFVSKSLHGIIWPEHWLQSGVEVLVRNKAVVDGAPSAMLNMRTIFCNDVFHNWMLMLTFGLCSPVFAVTVLFSVLLKMSLWVLLIGRFTRCILHDNVDATSTRTIAVIAPSQPSGISSSSSSMAVKNRDHGVHFALAALAGLYLPLFKVLTGSFWRLAWCSALFVALLGWDMAIDEVGWLQSVWVPLVPLGYVLTLRCLAHVYLNGSCTRTLKQSSADEKMPSSSHHHAMFEGVAKGGGVVSQSPLHVDRL